MLGNVLVISDIFMKLFLNISCIVTLWTDFFFLDIIVTEFLRLVTLFYGGREGNFVLGIFVDHLLFSL